MSVEPTETRTRELLYTSWEDPDTLELIIAGVTTDNGILSLYNEAMRVATDAWLLHKLGLLPDWWRLRGSIHVVGLTDKDDEVGFPEKFADQQLEPLSRRERALLRRGWTVVQTAGGGRIYRIPDRLLDKYDKELPPIMPVQILVITEQVSSKAPVLGEFSEF